MISTIGKLFNAVLPAALQTATPEAQPKPELNDSNTKTRMPPGAGNSSAGTMAYDLRAKNKLRELHDSWANEGIHRSNEPPTLEDAKKALAEEDSHPATLMKQRAEQMDRADRENQMAKMQMDFFRSFGR